MSIIKKIIILSLCLALSAQTHTASKLHKVAKFVTAPSMLLGASTSIYCHKLIEEKLEEFVNCEQELLEKQKWYFDNRIMNTVCRTIGIKNYSERIKEITDICNKHGVAPQIRLASSRENARSTRYKDKSIIIIDSQKPSLLLDYLAGHEYAHTKHNDPQTNITVIASVPVVMSSLYKGSQVLGASKKLSALCVASGLLSYPFINTKIQREKEYRCDRESSQNPEALEAGAQFLIEHELAEKENREHLKGHYKITIQDRLKELHPKIEPYLLRDLNTEYQLLCNDPDSKPIERLAHYTVEAEELFADHPPSGLRAQRLRDQAQAIREDTDKKRIEAKYACFSYSQ